MQIPEFSAWGPYMLASKLTAKNKVYKVWLYGEALTEWFLTRPGNDDRFAIPQVSASAPYRAAALRAKRFVAVARRGDDVRFANSAILCVASLRRFSAQGAEEVWFLR